MPSVFLWMEETPIDRGERSRWVWTTEPVRKETLANPGPSTKSGLDYGDLIIYPV